MAFSKILEPQEVVRASDLYGTIFGTQGVAAQPVNLTTTQFSHLAFVSVTAAGRPRQRPQRLSAWLVRGFLPLPRTAGVKTNLPMCLRRCESSSLGRFAERVGSWLHFSAAEVPCKTAPFASFSDRTEKGGPARPERIPIYEIVLMYFDETISLFQQAEAVQRLRSLSVYMNNNQLLQGG
ncbi:MAG: hypothetical protein MR815_00445 [Oscillospiraceae bacterium]|nr:hypothetical protein [Oscillospiraceae bacterium]